MAFCDDEESGLQQLETRDNACVTTESAVTRNHFPLSRTNTCRDGEDELPFTTRFQKFSCNNISYSYSFRSLPWINKWIYTGYSTFKSRFLYIKYDFGALRGSFETNFEILIFNRETSWNIELKFGIHRRLLRVHLRQITLKGEDHGVREKKLYFFANFFRIEQTL